MSTIHQPVPPKRFFIEAPLAAGQTVPLPKALQHRLRSVLRKAEGATLHLFNGTHGLWEATVTDAKARTAHISQQVGPQHTLPPLTLAIGMPKKDAWETILRQATEMGATTIIPLKTAFAQVDKLTNPTRTHAILAEAAEQCERLCLPTVTAVTPLETFLQSHQEPIAWAYERLPDTPPLPPCATALVGPEGGFSAAEVTHLRTCPQVHAFSLGPTILRADTAAIAALARISI